MFDFEWNADNWGSAYPPVNVEEICDAANNAIEDYISTNGLDLHDDDDREVIGAFSQKLWEEFSENDAILGIAAQYEEV